MKIRMEIKSVVLSFSVFVGLVSANDLYNNHVFKYDEDSFRSKVPAKPHFVKFFAPWCGHCKRLAPTWDELAEKYNKEDGDVTVAKVDCTTETALCAEQGVTGYPTLKFFKPGSPEGYKYRGHRDLSSLEAFVANSLGTQHEEVQEPAIPEPVGGLLELTDETFDHAIAQGQHFVKFYAPWCGHCQKLAPVWEELALSFEHQKTVSIGKIDCTTNRQSCNLFEVKAYPTLLWIVDGKKIHRYQGGRTHEELKAYVNSKQEEQNEDKYSEESKVPEVLTEPKLPLLELTDDNFDDVIQKGVTFVKFFAPWCTHCQRLAPIWEDLGKKFVTTASVKVAKVDCTTQERLCERKKVEGYPTLILYKNGKRKAEYSGLRDKDSLYNFIQKHKGHDEL